MILCEGFEMNEIQEVNIDTMRMARKSDPMGGWNAKRIYDKWRTMQREHERKEMKRNLSGYYNAKKDADKIILANALNEQIAKESKENGKK